VNIGLLHTAATGREGHEPYAPCAVDDLRSRGYDYWALGHIHARETLSDDPPIEFPGNTQGRHIRESGPKGCLHVRVDEDGAMQREFVPLDEVRWDVCRLAEDETGLPGVVDAFHEALPPLLESAGDRLLALRVVVESAPGCPAPDRDRLTNDLRAAALGAAPDRVWLEKVVRETARLQTPASESALAAVDAVFNDLLKADELPQALAKEVEALASSLPPGLRSRRGYNPADPAVWREAVEEARALLLETLSGGAEEET
jgi:DNA repair exonuclease SbcCD nuclease subunit